MIMAVVLLPVVILAIAIMNIIEINESNKR